MTESTKTLSGILNKLKADKKSLFTVILGLSGIFLILLSELPNVSMRDKDEAEALQSYADEDICRDVEELIGKIRGAGEVDVVLTYETKGERIFARDSDEELSSDGEGRINQKHIIVDSDKGEDGLVIKEIYPEIRGVAVVCSGGDDPEVKSQISSLLSALFDIGSNRISIAPRAEKE